MKSIKDDDWGKLQKTLSVAYNEREATEVGELWPVRVMGQIKSLPSMYPRTGYLEYLQQLVWRLSPVAVALVLLLSAALLQIDLTSDYELAKMFVEVPIELSLLGEYTI